MKTNNKNDVIKLTVSGLLLAIGIIIPRMFHIYGLNSQGLGQVFLPMHFSVFIAGVFLGQYYGLWIGFLTPLLNSLFGMPMFPMNIIMAFELCTYGFFAGLFVATLPKIKIFGKDIRVYLGLILSMIMGRVVYGIALFTAANLFGMEKLPKPLSIIASSITGIPGIVIQLIMVPVIVYALTRLTNSRQ